MPTVTNNSPTDTTLPSTSTHPMTTRLKAEIRIPKALLAVYEPKSVKTTLEEPHWFEAMSTKMFALKKNKTWVLVPLPENQTCIGCKWVLRIIQNTDDSFNRCKARFMAKGFHQQAGFDFSETFSLVVKPITIRMCST
ncbi:uncharacterized mitochondrial protein AtMg00820-like [Cannabis sativa]|uniref:uncharacterized mitochondrial protein AtMg00820-like n=1 Tax=Cannabis sativa TaxID=3483 RepID=UPI0029CA2CA0|nr:uncharacterized mitochondrial protein AtMg00820-like [Cannabis sativa]